MKNKMKLLKRIMSFAVFILLTFNSFAAVVSDNDGSAFITKAEFDTLKSSFQSQIDTYNHSIDSKIDGAIASYLAGIKLATTFDWELDINSLCFDKVKWKNLCFSSKYGEGALTVPQQNFLMGDEECYNGITWAYNIDGSSNKVSLGSFDLMYKPKFDQGYLDNNNFLDSWGEWVPHFLGNCTSYFQATHSSDDSGSNPEYGYGLVAF